MLKGKTAIITGASRGIGEAIAYKLASMGANTAVIYAGNTEAAENVCEKCRCEYGVEAKAYKCDVSDYNAVKDTVGKIKADFGTAHILVNNAGITRDGLLAMMKEEDFDSVVDTNLKGAFNMIRHCAGLFIRNREGCIVNITSVAGLTGNAGQCNYSASKAGLIGLTKSAAKELAPKNIRCCAVAPGFISTSMTDSQAENPLLKMIPLGEMGKTEDVADAVAYLATAKYVTGEVLRVVCNSFRWEKFPLIVNYNRACFHLNWWQIVLWIISIEIAVLVQDVWMSVPDAHGLFYLVSAYTENDTVYINVHGTGTPMNDKIETVAIKKALGEENAKKAYVSSTKSMTGHMLGAAGAIEALACLFVLNEGVIPPTINLNEQDEACNLFCVPNKAVNADITLALSNSLGFGSHNACLAFRKV